MLYLEPALTLSYVPSLQSQIFIFSTFFLTTFTHFYTYSFALTISADFSLSYFPWLVLDTFATFAFFYFYSICIQVLHPFLWGGGFLKVLTKTESICVTRFQVCHSLHVYMTHCLYDISQISVYNTTYDTNSHNCVHCTRHSVQYTCTNSILKDTTSTRHFWLLAVN